jgi:hypothetical protein
MNIYSYIIRGDLSTAHSSRIHGVDKNLRTCLNYQIRNYGPQDVCSLTKIAKLGVMRTPVAVDGRIVEIG